MFWQIYFYINAAMFALSTLVIALLLVLGNSPAAAVALVLFAWAMIGVGILGLASFIYRDFTLPRFVWVGSFVTVVVFTITDAYLTWPVATTGELYVYVGLIVFSLPLYYVFYRYTFEYDVVMSEPALALSLIYKTPVDTKE